MNYVHPASDELYYLRMLLNVGRGPLKFEDIRTFDGVIYQTVMEECNALGLLDNDRNGKKLCKRLHFGPHHLH